MKKKFIALWFALVAALTAQAQVVLNAANFPDANFRAALASRLGISEGDEITAGKIAATTYLNVSSKSIADLTGIEHFTALTRLDCDNNQLASLDVSQNTALTELYCYQNQIKDAEMNALVASLPTLEKGDFYVINTLGTTERNVCTKSQVAIAKEKGWTVYGWNGNTWVEYEGSEDAVPHLSLSSYSQTLTVGERVEVKILTGSGMYETATDNRDVVDVITHTQTISSPGELVSSLGNPDSGEGAFSQTYYIVEITAKSKGRSIVSVKDLSSGELAEISVTVTDGNGGSEEIGWQLVTDNGEQFPMSQVGMLVAVDESAYFSVLDINGNVLADEVLRVHFVNNDPVGVKNITTEKPQNMLKRYVDNQLTLVGVKGTVNVYSLQGVKVGTTYAEGQETVIDVSALPSGIYIVKCGNQSFKFNKK